MKFGSRSFCCEIESCFWVLNLLIEGKRVHKYLLKYNGLFTNHIIFTQLTPFHKFFPLKWPPHVLFFCFFSSLISFSCQTSQINMNDHVTSPLVVSCTIDSNILKHFVFMLLVIAYICHNVVKIGFSLTRMYSRLHPQYSYSILHNSGLNTP